MNTSSGSIDPARTPLGADLDAKIAGMHPGLNPEFHPDVAQAPAAPTLVTSFVLASFPVLLVLMLGLGAWVTRTIEHQVTGNSAANLALYVQSFLSDDLQSLAISPELTPAEIERIKHKLSDTPLGERVQSLKVWKEGGRVAYASRGALTGQVFEPTENLRRAWRGEVMASFDDLHDPEDVAEAALGVNLLEVYSPVRESGTERVIAVMEFYQDARQLAEQQQRSRATTWLVVCSSTLATFALLFLIVRRGGATIRAQREQLSTRVEQLSALLAQNQRLGKRLRRAARRTTTVHERVLRRLSADLHDGPAQSMSLALLRLDELAAPRNGVDAHAQQDIAKVTADIAQAMHGALSEIRQLSSGLALPELDELSLREVLERVVSAHTQRTGTSPSLAVEHTVPAGEIGAAVKATLYRVVQEALMNVHRHAGEAEVRVLAKLAPDHVKVEVIDDGPGFDVHEAQMSTGRLGLHGLRERVEALGGAFELVSSSVCGTRLHVTLPYRKTL